MFFLKKSKSVLFVFVILSLQLYGENLNNYFIENKGQWDKNAKYLANIQNMDAWITNEGITYDFYIEEAIPTTDIDATHQINESIVRKGHIVKMQIVNKNDNNIIRYKTYNELKQYYNYFIGSDKLKWAQNVKMYNSLEAYSADKKVNYNLYFDNNMLRYDIIINPGTEVEDISLLFDGANKIIVANDYLSIKTAIGDILNNKLFAYQLINNQKVSVECNFVQISENEVGLAVGSYNRTLPLIIDPLVYSTYIGSSAEEKSFCITRDGTNNIYIAGSTKSTSFPTSTGAYQTAYGANRDCFVSKFNSSGSSLEFSTFVGGSSAEVANAVAVDSDGDVYITGTTASDNYPTTSGAYSTTYNSGNDLFVSKLNSSGTSMVYSTFLGGSAYESGNSIYVDGDENAYVCGKTESTDYPTTDGVISRTFSGSADGIVAKFNSNGSALIFSTYIGGSDQDVFTALKFDASSNIYLTGNSSANDYPTTTGAIQTSLAGLNDCIYTKINGTATEILYSTYLGGADNDYATALVIDANNVYISGYSRSEDYPTTTSAYSTTLVGLDDIILSVIDNSTNTLYYSSYFGGIGIDKSYSIDVDLSGNIYLSGTTASYDFPVVTEAFQTEIGGGDDSFIVKIHPTNGLLYSSYIGGSSSDYTYGLILDSRDYAVISGYTRSTNFPRTTGAYQTTLGGNFDGFVLCINPTTVLDPTLDTPVLVQPFDGEVSVSTSPTLSWNLVDRATSYDVQLSTDISFTTTISTNSSTTLTTINNLASYTTYYWRVMASNESEISEWSQPWSFTTALSSPILSAPANNSTYISLNPTLSWSEVSGATNYEVQLSTDVDFTAPTSYSVTTLNQVFNGLSQSTQYFWRVKAYNSTDNSIWSSVWNFTTTSILVSSTFDSNDEYWLTYIYNSAASSAPVFNETGGNPGGYISNNNDADWFFRAPTKFLGDLSGIYNQQITFDLRHSTNNGPFENYDLIFIGNNTIMYYNFTQDPPVGSFENYSVTMNQNSGWLLLSTGLAPSQEEFTSILNNVQEILIRGKYSDASETTDLDNFIVYGSAGSYLNTPSLLTPLHNSASNQKPYTFSWNSVQSAISYNIQIAGDPEFSMPVVSESISTTSFTTNSLDGANTYYWRVNASNGSSASNWSRTWEFRTAMLPPVPANPVNYAVGVSLSPLFVWTTSNGATTYTIEIARDIDFTNIVYSANSSENIFTYPDVLNNNTSYYWRVKAANGTEESAWSEVYQFMTLMPVPVLLSPEDGAVLTTNTSATVLWEQINNTTHYIVWVAENAELTLNPRQQTVYAPSGTTTIYSLSPNTTYYWSVVAYNGANESARPTAWNFTTATAGPTLISPVNGSNLAVNYSNFTWEPLTDAVEYVFQISNSIGFETIVYASTVTTTVTTVENLMNGQTYYWRVKAIYSGSESNWSVQWNLLINIPGPNLLTPNYAATLTSNIAEFTWEAVNNAIGYVFEYSLDNSFISPILTTTVTTTSFTVNYLDYNSNYYWHVKAILNNTETNWSNTWNFFTPEIIPTKTVELTLALYGLWNETTQTHAFGAVSVELRSGATLMSSTLVSRKAGAISTSGVVTVDFSDIADDNYWVVVRSAGYLPLAIPTTVALSTSGVTYNFSTASSQAVGDLTAQIQPGSTGRWQVRCGDFNNTRSVTSTDASLFVSSNGRNVTTLIPE